MKLAPYIVAGVLAAGLGAGWLSASLAPVSAAQADAPVAVARLSHGGNVAGAAARRFAALDYGAPAEGDAAEIAEPPPPDIAVLFRRDLTAIEAGAGGRAVWIVDGAAPSSRRRIRRGQIYRDGWVVNAIGDQIIELRKDDEVRSIQAFEAPANF